MLSLSSSSISFFHSFFRVSPRALSQVEEDVVTKIVSRAADGEGGRMKEREEAREEFFFGTFLSPTSLVFSVRKCAHSHVQQRRKTMHSGAQGDRAEKHNEKGFVSENAISSCLRLVSSLCKVSIAPVIGRGESIYFRSEERGAHC